LQLLTQAYFFSSENQNSNKKLNGYGFNRTRCAPHTRLRSPPAQTDVLPFGRLWYNTPDNAIGYAMHSSRSHHAVVRVYDATGNAIRNARARGGWL
jgi:hypothetical protein